MGSFHKTHYKLCLKVNDERQIADAAFLLGEEVMDANGICTSREPKKRTKTKNTETNVNAVR